MMNPPCTPEELQIKAYPNEGCDPVFDDRAGWNAKTFIVVIPGFGVAGFADEMVGP